MALLKQVTDSWYLPISRRTTPLLFQPLGSRGFILVTFSKQSRAPSSLPSLARAIPMVVKASHDIGSICKALSRISMASAYLPRPCESARAFRFRVWTLVELISSALSKQAIAPRTSLNWPGQILCYPTTRCCWDPVPALCRSLPLLLRSFHS